MSESNERRQYDNAVNELEEVHRQIERAKQELEKLEVNIIVAGSRSFNNYELLEQKLDAILQNLDTQDIQIISGRANGADKLGERYAKEHSIKYLVFNVNWAEHGKRAGVKRNIEMSQVADALIAFWDGKSRGTRHMIDLAKQKGLLVRVIQF